MASSLQRLLNHSQFSRNLSALVENEIKFGDVGLVSGIPQDHLPRKVVIFSPARTATQQGSGKVGKWKINFMSTQKGKVVFNPTPYLAQAEASLEALDRNMYCKVAVDKCTVNKTKPVCIILHHGSPLSKWENPLMGWTSTGDPYANVGDSALSFDSEESGKEFAERHGWDYTVKTRHTPLLKAKAYADNFKWIHPEPPRTEQ